MSPRGQGRTASAVAERKDDHGKNVRTRIGLSAGRCRDDVVVRRRPRQGRHHSTDRDFGAVAIGVTFAVACANARAVRVAFPFGIAVGSALAVAGHFDV